MSRTLTALFVLTLLDVAKQGLRSARSRDWVHRASRNLGVHSLLQLSAGLQKIAARLSPRRETLRGA
jgi:hypothetical protein